MAKAKKAPSVLFRGPPAPAAEDKVPLEQPKPQKEQRRSPRVEAAPAPELHQRRRTQPFVIDEKVWRRIRNIGNKRMLDRDRGAPDASEVLREILALPAVLEWMEENE